MARTFAAELTEAQRLQRAGQFTRAIELYELLLKEEPGRADILLQLGLAQRALNRDADALATFDRARVIDSRLGEAHHQAGNVLKRQGRLNEAVDALRTATELAPANAAAWLNLGVALLDSDRATEAITAFRRALALEPNRPEAHNILGVALTAAGELRSAAQSLTAALRLRPGYAAAHNNLARVHKAQGLLAEAVVEYRRALAAQPDAAAHSNLLLALNFLPGLSPSDIFAEHRRWHDLYAARLTAPSSRDATLSSRSIGNRPVRTAQTAPRLRIGYVSPDFNHHAVAYFIAPVLAAHDRNRVEVFCYSNVLAPDATTAHLRKLPEHWRDISRADDAAATDLIRGDQIDLLVDLTGHTARNRLLVFARRPAHRQATWIGYPNTTGLPAMGFRFTDAICDPPGLTDAYHTEKLVRLPGPFSCYEPDLRAPEVGPLPAQVSGAVTFGCFNNFAKIAPPVITLWARLLRELPDSRLLLKSRGLADADVIARVRAAFAAEGVKPDRIELNGQELSVHDHLSLYHRVDIALDPFPYNGTTTTCEALWMGVPVVTLTGRTHAARVGTSLLTHTGLTEWIAATADEYITLAVAATHDLPRLTELRAGLRERMHRGPLCDAKTFTRGLEDVFEQLVARPT